jgi:hypothetical protein
VKRPPQSLARDVALRLALVAGALVLLSRAQAGFLRFREVYLQRFDFEIGPWALWVVPAALAGAAFAVAAAPARTSHHSPVVSFVVGVVPILLLAQTVYAFWEATSGRAASASWLSRLYWYTDTGPQFVLAVMAGVALGLGFVRRTASSPREGAPNAP